MRLVGGSRANGRAGRLLGAAVGAVVIGVGAWVHWHGSAAPPPGPSVPAARELDIRVTAVTDGDTLRIRAAGGGDEQRVRLLAVDSPEVAAGGTPGDCYAEEATNLTTELLTTAVDVRLVRDPTQPDRDQFGRLLRYVLVDGEDLGRKLVAAGAARVWIGTPPADRVGIYREAQTAARHGGLGLWGVCADTH